MKKRASHSGFLLISLVIYGAITVLLVAATIRLAVLVIPVTYALMGWCSSTNFYTAYDFIMREVACAPTDPALWLKADIEGFIWRSEDTVKGIIMHKEALLYKEGAYTNGMWSKSHTSLLAQDCRCTEGHITVQGNRVIEFLCCAELISKPEHRWECRQVLYGGT